MKLLLRLASIALLLGLAGATARAADEEGGAGHLAETITVPDGLSRRQVHKAIDMAGAGRGWRTTAESDDQVVFRYEKGKWRSTLTVAFDPKEIRIFSNSGKLDHKGGTITKQEDPRWVRWLRDDIVKDLKLAAADK